MKIIPEMCRAHFDFERTGWRLSQKCVVRTSILRVLMKVIPEMCRAHFDFERTGWRLSQKCVVRTSILRVTDGRLSQKCAVRTKFDIYVFICFYLYTFNPTILITPPKMMIY
jgi:hypothetical protein